MHPKNRVPNPLPVLAIHLTGQSGVFVTNPMGTTASVVYTLKGEKISGPSIPDELIDILAMEPIDGVVSELSGEPAVIYASDDIELRLTPVEMLRLLNRTLTENEYHRLIDRYGMFYEIHDDFYDPDSGACFQPIFEQEEVDEMLAKRDQKKDKPTAPKA